MERLEKIKQIFTGLNNAPKMPAPVETSEGNFFNAEVKPRSIFGQDTLNALDKPIDRDAFDSNFREIYGDSYDEYADIAWNILNANGDDEISEDEYNRFIEFAGSKSSPDLEKNDEFTIDDLQDLFSINYQHFEEDLYDDLSSLFGIMQNDYPDGFELFIEDVFSTEDFKSYLKMFNPDIDDSAIEQYKSNIITKFNQTLSQAPQEEPAIEEIPEEEASANLWGEDAFTPTDNTGTVEGTPAEQAPESVPAEQTPESEQTEPSTNEAPETISKGQEVINVIGDGLSLNETNALLGTNFSGAYATKGLQALTKLYYSEDIYNTSPVFEDIRNAKSSRELLSKATPADETTTLREGDVVVTGEGDSNIHCGLIVGTKEVDGEIVYLVAEANSAKSPDGKGLNVTEYRIGGDGKCIQGYFNTSEAASTSALMDRDDAVSANEPQEEAEVQQEPVQPAQEPQTAENGANIENLNSVIGTDSLSPEELAEKISRETPYNKGWATQGTCDYLALVWGQDNPIVQAYQGFDHVDRLKERMSTENIAESMQIGDIAVTRNADGTNWHSGVFMGYEYDSEGNITGYKIAEANSDDGVNGHGTSIQTYEINSSESKSIVGYIPVAELTREYNAFNERFSALSEVQQAAFRETYPNAFDNIWDKKPEEIKELLAQYNQAITYN